MRTVLAIASLLSVLTLSAQRECSSVTYIQKERTSNRTVQKSMEDADAFIRSQVFNNTRTSVAQAIAATNTIKIPVVIHVLYNSEALNISQAQIESQLKVLNDDFRRRNSDSINTPDRFKPFAADANIEFVLATADPKGRVTTGIIRKQTSVAYFTTDDKIKFSNQGGDDAWDSKSYLNIWVGSLRKVLGYSSAPGGAADKDGVVITTSAFGTINTAAPYNLGRTAVHEVGHYLGLKHIWGDAACGDDGIQDTPTQSSYTTGCPSGFRSTCNNGSLGDMYMNYMDFTNDVCLNLFTEGQKTAMRSLFNAGGPRASLLSSKGLNSPWLEEAALPAEIITNTNTISLFPNPATSVININFNNDASWMNQELKIVNMMGATMQKVLVSSTLQTISIASLKPGIYMIQGEAAGKKLMQKLVKL